MKVFNLFGTHPLYQTFLEHPPRNVVYVNRYRSSISKHYQREKTRKLLRKFQSIFSMPRLTVLPYVDADLIHTSRGIIPLTRTPYVMDIEFFYSFSSHNHLLAHRNLFQKILYFLLMKTPCRKIMVHSRAALESIKNNFKHFSKLSHKFDILYPAVSLFNYKRKKEDPITLLFVANAFYAKGGLEVVDSYCMLKEKYDVRLIVSCRYVPPEIRNSQKYKDIIFLDYIDSREEFFRKTYAVADIFVFPTFIDTFGYVLLEAMAFKLPIVATRHFTIPEIVRDGHNGFLIEPKITFFDSDYSVKYRTPSQLAYFRRMIRKRSKKMTTDLFSKLKLLIEEDSLRRKMGRNSFKEVSEGKFSIKKRNRKLLEIYRQATER